MLSDGQRESLATGGGERMEGTRYVELYPNGVAVLGVYGPMFRRANSMRTSGAYSTNAIQHDIQAMRKSQNVRAALIVTDSGGGEATGLDEVAQDIWELGQEKYVEGFNEGMGASAAYYLLSSTRRITGSRMSLSGSIGVVMGVRVPEGKDEDGRNVLKTEDGEVIVEFVSAKSPHKRLDPTTKEGREKYQNIVDRTADIFISDVARFRGLDAADLPHQYGDGGIFVAEEAQEMGLIDDVGSFTDVIDRLTKGDWAKGRSFTGASGEGVEARNGGGDMSLWDKLKGNKGGEKGRAATTGQASSGAGRPLTVKQMLADLDAKRPDLEARFEDTALLYATRLVTNSVIPSAVEGDVAFEMQTALVDDALYGGTVIFPVMDAGGNETEAEGTRQQQIEAKYQRWPKQSLAEKRVRAVQDGEEEGQVLSEGRRTRLNGQPAGRDPGDNGSTAYTDDDLLNRTDRGAAVLNRRKRGSVDQQSSATN